MYRTKAIYQLSDLKQSSWKILRLFEIYRQSGSQAPVSAIYAPQVNMKWKLCARACVCACMCVHTSEGGAVLVLL